MASASSNGTRGTLSQTPEPHQQDPLHRRFPVNTSWEITLTSQETVKGLVYCTDDASQTVVLQSALVHTTLASEIRMINAQSISKAVPLPSPDEGAIPLSAQLPKVQRRALEEREKKAIRLAEESLRHINQKASPRGQLVFDKLLKACSEAVWKGESILVLNQVQVDPPYGPEQCKIIRSTSGKKALDDGSVERIRKIVAAANGT